MTWYFRQLQQRILSITHLISLTRQHLINLLLCWSPSPSFFLQPVNVSQVCLSLHLLSSLLETAAELHSRWKLPRTQRQLSAVAWRCEFLRQPTGCAHHGVRLRADQSRGGKTRAKTHQTRLLPLLCFVRRWPSVFRRSSRYHLPVGRQVYDRWAEELFPHCLSVSDRKLWGDLIG